MTDITAPEPEQPDADDYVDADAIARIIDRARD